MKYKSQQSLFDSLYMILSYINSGIINQCVIYNFILKLLLYNNINDNQSRKEARS
jgi:hypothetical protein